MSAVSFTAVQIKPLVEQGALLQNYTAGGTLAVGQVVALSADGKVDPADANGSSILAMGIGILVESYDGETAVISGDPVTVCVFGPVSGFSGMTPGANHFVSDTAGKVDTATGTFDRVLGYAKTAGILFVNPQMNVVSSA